MQHDGKLRVNSVVSDNGVSVNGRTKNAKLMEIEKKQRDQEK